MSRQHPRATGRTRPALVAAGALALLAACAGPDDGSGEAGSTTPATVTLVTHDSFHVDDAVLAAFEQESGLDVQLVAPGDGGALVNQLILTKDAPLGDATFGIDNTFASRAIEEGVLEPYTSEAPAAADAARYAVDDSGSLTAVDYGDVCVNVDHGWFAEQGLAEPTTLDDLADPAYKDLLVVPSATTSSPGLAFQLATVGAFGEDGWQAYWQRLTDNGVQVAADWSEAYYVDFTAGGGDGPRPLVVSYASSPPFTVPEGGDEPTTGALLDTCFRQVEYAGVLAGAENPEGARKLVDFLLSDEVQAGIPEGMYMYPVSAAVDLPAAWQQWAPLAPEPFTVDPQQIADRRDEWIRTWTDTVIG